MKVIFVSGKYRDTTEYLVFENILHARRVAFRLWQEGWAVICPHTNTILMTHDQPLVFIRGDLEILKRCDAIYLLNNWQNSEGARGELKSAKELGLEIYYEEKSNEPTKIQGTSIRDFQQTH